MPQLVTRLFDTADHARHAAMEVERAGIPSDALHVWAQPTGDASALLGTLIRGGVSREEAEVYAEALRRGGALVAVEAEDLQAAQAALDSQPWVDVGVRREAYRRSGWTRFDDSAAPYTEAQIAHERAR